MNITINDAPIDELIEDAILILNKKGYVTNYSCQGHVEESAECRGCRKYNYKRGEECCKFGYKFVDAYVSFVNMNTLRDIKKYKKVRLPKDYNYDSAVTIRAYMCGTDEEIEAKIISTAKALTRWAKRLPTREDLNRYIKENKL